jgi:uncharacterized protein YjbI with pentapeptide repeats
MERGIWVALPDDASKGTEKKPQIGQIVRDVGHLLIHTDAFWWVLPAIVIVGIGIWGSPGPNSNRSSDLGAAMIGGAVIAAAVLLVEQRFAGEAENRNIRFQIGLQKELPSIDLRGKNLSDSHWPQKSLPLANMSRVSLDGSFLQGCDFTGALFTGASLIRTELRAATMRGAVLGGADLTEASLVRANLRDCDFSDPADPEIEGAAVLARANLSRADLRLANLIGVDLHGANLNGTILSGAILIGTDLSGADLRNSNLTDAIFFGVKGLGTSKHDGTTKWPAGFSP